MKSKDMNSEQRQNALNSLAEAFKSGDAQAVTNALDGFYTVVKNELQADARADMQLAVSDNAAMAARGGRPLTSAENAYYSAVIKAMTAADPQNAFTNLDKVMPETIIDGVIDSIKSNHPLLSRLNFVNTTAVTKFILNAQPSQTAKWGALDAAVTKELNGAFKTFDMKLLSLTAFMVVGKDSLELGPVWLDRYIRETLAESIALAWEIAVVDGTGKDEPIGMTRDVSKTAQVVNGAYPKMVAQSLNDLLPETMGGLVKKLARDPADPTKARAVNDLIFVVNPFDYWGKIMPATCFRKPDGGWVRDVLPIPADIIQSAGVTANEAVLGIPSKYFAGLGVQSKEGLIEYSDEFRFLNRERVYMTHLQGNARPLDEYAFLRLDISGLKASGWPVTILGDVNMVEA